MRYALLTTILLSTVCYAAPTTIRVADSSGAPVKDVLVIVESLDSGYDASRQLTDEQGRIRPAELKAGLYRVIATTPYGLWETAIKEFLVAAGPVDLGLTLQPQPSHGYGDIATVGIPRAELQVLKPDGTPASGAELLVRDEDATLYLERRYKTDENGKSNIELVGTPTVLIVIYDGKLITRQLAGTETHATVRFSSN